MSKSRDLADFVAAGGQLADGVISVSEISDLTATAAELNTLDGITATVTELNYMDGVTSAVQTQIDGKFDDDSNLSSFVSAFTLPTSDGTADQILTTNGSGTLAFADAGGGAWEFLGSAFASGSATDLTGIISSTHEQYAVLFEDVNISSNQLYMQFFINGSVHTGSNYNASNVYRDSTGSEFDRSVSSDARFRLSNAANLNQSGTIYISSGQTGGEPSARYHISSGGTTVTQWLGAGVLNVTGSITGVRFNSNGGTFSSGRFRIYGIVKS